jgi:hypothetical protein
MNIGMVPGRMALVTVAEGPAVCKLFEVRTASGSVLVKEALVVVAAGPMRKVVAVMNWYCWSRLIDGLDDVDSVSVEMLPDDDTEPPGKMSGRLKMTELELELLELPPPGIEIDSDSEVGSGGAGVEIETLVGGSTMGVLIEVSGGRVIGSSDVEFPGSKMGGKLIEMEMIGGSVGVALVELSEVETTGGSVGAGASLVELVEVGSSVGKGIEIGSEIDKLIRGGSSLVDTEGVGSTVLLELVLVELSAVEVETLSLVLSLVLELDDESLVLSLVLAGAVELELELELVGSVGAGSVGAGSVGAGSVGSVGAVGSTGTVMTEGGPSIGIGTSIPMSISTWRFEAA